MNDKPTEILETPEGGIPAPLAGQDSIDSPVQEAQKTADRAFGVVPPKAKEEDDTVDQAEFDLLKDLERTKENILSAVEMYFTRMLNGAEVDLEPWNYATYDFPEKLQLSVVDYLYNKAFVSPVYSPAFVLGHEQLKKIVERSENRAVRESAQTSANVLADKQAEQLNLDLDGAFGEGFEAVKKVLAMNILPENQSLITHEVIQALSGEGSKAETADQTIRWLYEESPIDFTNLDALNALNNTYGEVITRKQRAFYTRLETTLEQKESILGKDELSDPSELLLSLNQASAELRPALERLLINFLAEVYLSNEPHPKDPPDLALSRHQNREWASRQLEQIQKSYQVQLAIQAQRVLEGVHGEVTQEWKDLLDQAVLNNTLPAFLRQPMSPPRAQYAIRRFEEMALAGGANGRQIQDILSLASVTMQGNMSPSDRKRFDAMATRVETEMDKRRIEMAYGEAIFGEPPTPMYETLRGKHLQEKAVQYLVERGSSLAQNQLQLFYEHLLNSGTGDDALLLATEEAIHEVEAKIKEKENS